MLKASIYNTFIEKTILWHKIVRINYYLKLELFDRAICSQTLSNISIIFALKITVRLFNKQKDIHYNIKND